MKFCSQVQPSPLLEREGQAVRMSCAGGPDTGLQEKVKLIATPAAALADSEQLLAAAGSVFPFYALRGSYEDSHTKFRPLSFQLA